MIIRRYLFFLILLFCPLLVSADDKDININSVELVEKSENVVELENARFEDLEVWFNLKFFEVNDTVKYKVVISNESDKDYLISDDNQDFSEEKYIKYVFEYQDEDMVIKAGTEEFMYVAVTYYKEVSDEDYVDNVYKNDNYMNLSFAIKEEHKEEEKIVEEKNPNTKDLIIAGIIIVFLASLVILVYSIQARSVLYGIIGIMLLLPSISNALELFKIDINAHIEIERKVIGNFSLCGSTTYQFEIGMTFNEWFESEYNVDFLSKLSENEIIILPSAYYIFNTTHDRDNRINAIRGDELIIQNQSYYCRGVAECVAPDSRIMITLDGNSKLAKEINENDEVVYYDFESNTMKIGTIKKVYKHKDATDFIRYTLKDGSYIEATDYHPIYTNEGWKSYTNRNGYSTPVVGDKVKTNNGWVEIIKIELYKGKEDFYDFEVVSKNNEKVDNYYANGILVHSAY